MLHFQIQDCVWQCRARHAVMRSAPLLGSCLTCSVCLGHTAASLNSTTLIAGSLLRNVTEVTYVNMNADVTAVAGTGYGVQQEALSHLSTA